MTTPPGNLPARPLGAALAVAAALLLALWLWSSGGEPPRQAPPPVGPEPTGVAADAVPAAPTDAPGGAESAPRQAASALPRTHVALDGRVMDQLGRPLADVLVTLDGPGDADHEVRTDAKGRFTIDALRPGSYQLLARGPQLPTHWEFVEYGAEQERITATVRVDAGALLSGCVTDASGQPIAGARVTPWRRGPVGEELDPQCAVTTGTGGWFRLHGATSGFTSVYVECPGFVATKSRLWPAQSAVVQLRRAQ